MSQSSDASASARVEAFLSGAYRRILRITLALSVAAATGAGLGFGWRSGLGLAIGSLVGYINFVWLHRASVMMTDRMIGRTGQQPSRLRLLLAFGGRYLFVIAAAYVIFRGWPRMLAGFTAALFFPVLAATCEGIYEALAKINRDQSQG